MKFVLNTLFLIFLINNSYSQSDELITKIDFYYTNEIFTIDYDINTNLEYDSLFISVEIYKAKSNQKMPLLTSLSGNVGKVSRGLNKKINWTPISEGYVIDEEIYVILKAKPIVDINKKKHLFKSLLFPGLGDNKVRNSKINIISGGVAYTGIGSSILLNRKAILSYDLYTKEYELEKSKALFSEAKKYKNISIVTAGFSILVWTIDIALLNRKINYVDKNIRLSNYYSQIADKIFIITSEKKHINTKTPYDLAIENAENILLKESYYLALEEFQRAKKLKIGNTEFVDQKIQYCTRQIVIIEENNKKYDSYISNGLKLFEEKQFSEAQFQFRLAIQLKPNEYFPKQKNEEIESILIEEKRKEDFSYKVKKGDIYFNNKAFGDALSIYLDANKLIDNNSYVLTQIKACELKLEQIRLANEKKQKDILFNKYILEATTLVNQGLFNDALTVLYQAQDIYPNSKKTEELIDKCNRLINEDEKKKLIELDKQYKDYITEADRLWNNKSYDNAKTYYQLALDIKPNESFPKERINKIIAFQSEEPSSNSLSALYNENKSSVFIVYNSDSQTTAQGSGFFINSSGIAVSNYHNFEGFYKANSVIFTSDGKQYKINEILVKDSEKDYIIFTLKNPNKVKFNPVKIAKSLPDIGLSAFAIGNPEGFEQTLSNGIISGYREDQFYIQTTTPITHGSSGGPLFNMNGEVIGITTMGKQEGSLFFAINVLKLNLSKYL